MRVLVSRLASTSSALKIKQNFVSHVASDPCAHPPYIPSGRRGGWQAGCRYSWMPGDPLI